VLKGWIHALRPRTLPLAWSAVTTGALDARGDAFWHHPVYLPALVTALLLQMVSNLANDYGDFTKGVDNDQRAGPRRALQSGQLTPRQARKGLIVLASAAFISGLITLHKAWDTVGSAVYLFLFLGLLAIVAAFAYTIGKKPYGYRGLGEGVAFFFFGPVAVSGTYFLMTNKVYYANLVHGLAMGLWVSAVLLINNIRDMAGDAASGKITLAVRLGSQGARYLLAGLLFTGAAGFPLDGAWPLTLTAWLLALPLLFMTLMLPAPLYDRLLRLMVVYILLNTVVKLIVLS
jgi:1,4-dihydroxy-2-naphthoate octaprenyltransferase